jgi:hypothetical protein
MEKDVGFMGGSLQEAVQFVEAKKWTPQQLTEKFGRIEAEKGFGGLQIGMGKIQELRGDITAAGAQTEGEDAQAGVLAAGESRVELRVAKARRISANREMLAEMDRFGVAQVERQAAGSEIKAAGNEARKSFIARMYEGAGARYGQGLEYLAGGEEGGIEPGSLIASRAETVGRLGQQVRNPIGGAAMAAAGGAKMVAGDALLLGVKALTETMQSLIGATKQNTGATGGTALAVQN